MALVETVDALVIGAGVVGLAVARALALAGREVVVLEAEPRMGAHASSRNSQVIHAGIYYQPGSLKARSCIAGRGLLYRYCEERGIAHRRIGKLLVAVESEEISRLHALVARARDNGVDDIRLLARGEWETMEPGIRAAAVAWSPASGIVDVHGLMANLLADCERAGGVVVMNSEVLGGRLLDDGVELRVSDPAEYRVRCRTVINCAGLRATQVALQLGVAPRHVPRPYFARGQYFALQGKSPFQHLIYPLPEAGGLGIHATLDLGGQLHFGPDVRWCENPDYAFEAGLEANFRAAVSRYYPGIADREIHGAHCGVRTKLAGPGEHDADFRIDGPSEHGCNGLVNLYGIESPGLTASLSLADIVAERFAA